MFVSHENGHYRVRACRPDAGNMGQCLGTPSPPRDSSAAAQKASVTNVSQVSADQTAKPPDAAPPSVVPVGSTASVSIMPPWASHGELEGNNRPCLVRPTPTTPASDPATTALRSNLSEVRSATHAGLECASSTMNFNLRCLDCKGMSVSQQSQHSGQY